MNLNTIKLANVLHLYTYFFKLQLVCELLHALCCFMLSCSKRSFSVNYEMTDIITASLPETLEANELSSHLIFSLHSRNTKNRGR